MSVALSFMHKEKTVFFHEDILTIRPLLPLCFLCFFSVHVYADSEIFKECQSSLQALADSTPKNRELENEVLAKMREQVSDARLAEYERLKDMAGEYSHSEGKGNENSIDLLKQALEIVPEDYIVMSRLAKHLTHAKRFTEAIEYRTAVIAIEGYSKENVMNLILTLRDAKEYQAMLEAIDFFYQKLGRDFQSEGLEIIAYESLRNFKRADRLASQFSVNHPPTKARSINYPSSIYYFKRRLKGI